MNGDKQSESLDLEGQRVFIRNAAACGWIAICLSVLWSDSDDKHIRTSLFVAGDVALVCLASAFPCGLMIARWVGDLLGSSSHRMLRVLCWIGAFTALTLLHYQGLRGGIVVGDGFAGYIIRPAFACLLIAPSVWVWSGRSASQPGADARWLAWVLTTGLIALALPSIYVVARCRQDVGRFRELSQQSRLGEASIVAHRLRRLAPGLLLNGQPVTRVVADIDRSVRRLQTAVATMPPSGSSDEDWLLRARQLAILGQTDAALEALTKLKTPRPDASNLAGTIHETCGNWRQALDHYSQAETNWASRPNSPEREAGRIQATTGIAYALRKQGRYAEAEQAYHRLLALSPNADAHFLLAQFYEDTQQTTLARQHAWQAMELAPERFQQSGRRLINKLATMHLGCFRMLSEQTKE